MIIRRDLPAGFAAAQIVHAAGESARLSSELPPGTHAVALAVPDEAALVHLRQSITRAEIPHAAIVEDAAPYSGQLTAIGIAPMPRELVRRLLSSLPKYGKEVVPIAA